MSAPQIQSTQAKLRVQRRTRIDTVAMLRATWSEGTMLYRKLTQSAA